MTFDVSLRCAPLLALLVSLISAPPARAATLSLDPAVPLTNGWSAGEWNGEGDFQGWTISQVSGATVSGGVLRGAASGADPQLSLLNIVGGPDLDLGNNDCLELRLQVPAGYTGDIQVFWGTTNLPGISSGRVVTLASTNLPQDGAFHLYRLDLSLEPAWQGFLTDLRIDPLGGASAAGQSFALDYVRVGDVGPAYQPNYLYYAQGTATVFDAVSKHCRVVWGPSNATWQATAQASVRGNLRNMEDQFALYTKVLDYREPCESTDPAKRNGTRSKVNLIVGNTGLSQHLGGGYFMGYIPPGCASSTKRSSPGPRQRKARRGSDSAPWPARRTRMAAGSWPAPPAWTRPPTSASTPRSWTAPRSGARRASKTSPSCRTRRRSGTTPW